MRSIAPVAPSVALLAGLASAAAPLAAQPAEPPPPAVFGETVEVRVVNLEVVVTDRDGLPVAGLAPEDFRLLVDGEETAIGYFTEVRGGTAVEAAGGPSVAGLPDLAPGEPVGTSYLVFVDDYFAIARDRDRVLDSIAAQLGRLGPEDRMAIVAWDGRDLAMLTSWSGSAPELERALKAARARPALGLRRVAERRSFLDDSRLRRRGSRIGAIDRLDVTEQHYAETLEQQIENVVSAAAAALRGFANPPGRKVLLLLSGGWPYDVVEYVARDVGRVVHEPRIERGDRLLAPLVDTANRLGYTIFGVDVPGLATDFDRGADQFETPTETAGFSSFLRENNSQYSLHYVSRQTGGRALVNAGRLEALERAAAATRTYYWIGFTPAWQGDDRRHRVEVEVRRDGLRVASRAGYLDSSRAREVSMAVESVLLFGSGPGVRPLALDVGRPQKSSLGRMRVPIRFELPVSEITFLPAAGARVADLELRVAAVDEHGGRSEVPVIPIRLTLPGEPEPGGTAGQETALELRRTGNRLAVAVYDPLSGTIWSATADVRP
jgi:VWFA-related protein